MEALGIRFGLGTDGTRADGFRLMDAAESLQRAAFGLATGDSSCGGGWLVDTERPEFTPSYDLVWELVRYGNRDLRLWKGCPVDWDARALLAEVREHSEKAIRGPGIKRVHPVSTDYRDKVRLQ